MGDLGHSHSFMSSSSELTLLLSSLFGRAYPSRIVFVGVGNRMRGDDGVGPVLIDHLSDHLPNIIDTGVTPEEYTGVIKRLNPSVIIIVDSADFGAKPGSVRMVEAGDISQVRISVHKISLEIIMDYLREETGADVFLLGIQPADISYSSTLSPDVSNAACECASVLISLLKGKV